jgi:cystathionine beta-lyase
MTVVADEIHCDLVFEGYKHIPIATLNEDLAKNTVTLSSASKTFNIAGLHCAQVAFGSKELLATFRNFPSILLGGVSSLGIEAAITAYSQASSWLDAVMDVLHRNRSLVEEWASAFPEMGFVKPEGTYLAWMDLGFLNLGPGLTDMIKDEAQLVLSDGLAFGPAGSGHVRVNFATSEEILRGILERLRVFIETHGT